MKIFFTQIESVVLLMSDPRVGAKKKWEGMETHKNRNIQDVSAQNVLFFSPIGCYLPARTHFTPARGHRFFLPSAPHGYDFPISR